MNIKLFTPSIKYHAVHNPFARHLTRFSKVFYMSMTIVMLASSCTLAPEYVKPASPIPHEWPQGEAYDDNTQKSSIYSNVATLNWQNFFTDKRLQKIIYLALENNRDLQIAALNIERARGIYGLRRAEILPAINTNATGGETRVPSELSRTGKATTEEQYSVNFGITSWEIDFFGRIRSLKEQALQEYLATEQAKRIVQTALISETARVYLTLGADSKNLKLSQNTLETQENIYNLIRERYSVGLATEIELHQAQTQLDTADKNVSVYTQLTALDQNALNLLIGLSSPEELLPQTLTDISVFEKLSAGLTSEILLNRPDILQSEHQLKAAFANIGAARAAFFPFISLTSTFGTASDELSGLFNSGSDTWTLSPTINLPIFDTRIWASLRVSETDRKIAQTNYEKTIQIAFREVADTLAVAGTIDQQLKSQKSIVYSTQTIYDLSSDRYLQGIDSYLSVLDAQRTLYTAQQDLVSLNLAKLANHVKLYEVLGGGANEANDNDK